MNIIQRGQVYGTGTNSAAITMGPFTGLIVGRNGWYTSPGAGTITLYRPRSVALANAAVTSGTTLVIKTDSAGKVDGSVLTTNDYVLCCKDGTWYLSSISSVAAVSSSTVSLGLGSAVTVAALGSVYICRAADIVALVTGTETVNKLEYWFVAAAVNYPVHAVLAATGTCRLSTTFDVER